MRPLLAVVLASCATNQPAAPPPAAPAPALDPRFVGAIANAATAYRTWAKIDNRPAVAPVPCAAGSMQPIPERPRMSTAAESPHGKKLFFVWASDRATYTGDGPVANGFAVIKESFRAVELGPDEGTMGKTVTPDRKYSLGAPSGLFVMVKVGERDGADAGWIYGTVVNGSITTAGRVATCASCHADATHDRLFGLPAI